MRKGVLITAFTLTGTVIGAGILGLPYVFSQSGFLVGLFWLVLLGLIMIYVNLAIGEITLRTKGIHQLPGLAERYIGKNGRNLMFLALIFGVYSALLAYLIGIGESLSLLVFATGDYSLIMGGAFWLLMTFMLGEGLRALKRTEYYGVIIFTVIILGVFIFLIPQINMDNLTYVDLDNVFFPFGVTLFALLGFSSIPELRRLIRKNEDHFMKAIVIGMVVPMILYFLFALTFVGVLGKSVPEVATLGFGGIILLLGIFTMLTSYFVLAFVLKDVFTYDLDQRGFLRFLFVALIPLLLYLIVSFLGFDSFIKVLGIGGVISGGIVAIMALFMNMKAKKKGNRSPEYEVRINYFIVYVLSLIFILGVVVELFF